MDKLAVWPHFAKFHHFGKILNYISDFLRAHLVFGILLNLLWQILYVIGNIFLDLNGQKWANNLAIWSHCK